MLAPFPAPPGPRQAKGSDGSQVPRKHEGPVFSYVLSALIFLFCFLEDLESFFLPSSYLVFFYMILAFLKNQVISLSYLYLRMRYEKIDWEGSLYIDRNYLL